MSLRGDVDGLAARIRDEFNTLRAALTTSLSGKADDDAVVKTSGAQSVQGLKTFVNGVATAAPSAANMAVRNDDSRLTNARPWSLYSGAATSGQVPTWNGSAFVPGTVASGGGLGGVVDCSAMTTAAQINAATLAAPQGSTIWLGARPSSAPLTIEATIVLRPRQWVSGAGGRSQNTCIKAGASFPSGAPLLAAQGYLNNGTVADTPIQVTGLDLDASSKTGSHGLVVYNFWSHFEDIQVSNIDGPAAHGFHVTDRSADGTNVSTNSHSENTFVRLRFYDHTGNATAFFAESNNGESNQDGHLLDSFFASISGDGVRVTRAAGWSIENSHFYGIGYNGIALGNCYATKVIRNYIEDFGGDDGLNNGADPTYGYYSGIMLETVLDTRASVVALNTVSVAQPSSPAGNQWTCFGARAGWAQDRANVVMVGNTATWATDTAPATSRSWAYRLGEGEDPNPAEDPPRMLHVEWAANQTEDLDWWTGDRYVESDTVTISAGNAGDLTGTVSTLSLPTPIYANVVGTYTPSILTFSWASGSYTMPICFNLTLSGNGTYTGTWPLPTDTALDQEVFKFAVTATGTGTKTFSFASGYRVSTGVSRSYTVPTGQVLLAAIQYSSLISAWVITAVTVSST